MSVDQSGRRSYLSGSWFGIFGEHAAVLLPPTEKRRVAALWELLDDGAGFDEVLDALIATGLRELPGFVLVSDAGEATRVVVRGHARVSFETSEGPVAIEAADAGTWVERTVTGVRGTVLDVADPAEDDAPTEPESPLTLSTGLVRVSRVQTPVPAATASTAEPATAEPAIVPVVAPVADPGLDTDPDVGMDTDPDVSLAEPVVAQAVVDEPVVDEPVATDDGDLGEPTERMSFEDLGTGHEEGRDDGPGDDREHGIGDSPGDGPPPDPEPVPVDPPADPVWDAPPPAPDFGSGAGPERPQWSPAPPPANPFGPGPGPGPAAPAAPEPEAQPTPPFGEQQPAPYEPPPQAEQAPAAYGSGSDHGGSDHGGSDHDGDTRAGDYDPSVYARSQPGIPGQPPAPSVTARPVARLVMSHGESVDVDRAILVGRAPEARRFTATDQPRLVTVPSPNQEISSTHLEVRPGSGVDHGSAVVTDMGSTNGTVLVQPGLPPEDLQPGITVQLIPGAVIDLGDGLTIQVANP